MLTILFDFSIQNIHCAILPDISISHDNIKNIEY